MIEKMVDLVGIEPTTSSMPWKRAPSCATGPLGNREKLLPLDSRPPFPLRQTNLGYGRQKEGHDRELHVELSKQFLSDISAADLASNEFRGADHALVDRLVADNRRRSADNRLGGRSRGVCVRDRGQQHPCPRAA